MKTARYLKLMVITIAVAVVSAPFHAIPQSTNGLLAHYPLDGNAQDASGNGKHATVYETLDYVAGPVGSCAVFDGHGDYILCPVNLNNYTNVTMSFWLKAASFPSDRNQLISNDAGTYGRVINLHGVAKGTNVGKLELDHSSGAVGLTDSPIELNTWYHIVGVWAAESTKLYLNGREAISGAGSVAGLNDATAVSVGGISFAGNFTAGSLDDLRIYGRALSASEVSQLYNSNLHLGIEFSQVRLCWNSFTNSTYQVQYSTALAPNIWVDLGSPIPGNGGTQCITDDIFSPQRFYRVVPTP